MSVLSPPLNLQTHEPPKPKKKDKKKEKGRRRREEAKKKAEKGKEMRNVTGRLYGGVKSGRFLPLRHESRRCVRFPARSLSFSDDYSALGLSPFASKTDVKRAYKRLALKVFAEKP